MSRKNIINIHLILASFFAPVLIIMALSGGLYLLDVEGEFSQEVVFEGTIEGIDFNSADRPAEIQKMLTVAGIEHSFDYVVGNQSTMVTRPTSSAHYVFQQQGENIKITARHPDVIKTLVELHKGHGPSYFKVYQEFMAAGLLIILLSGLMLGLTSPVLRKKSFIVSGLGLVSFLLLAFII